MIRKLWVVVFSLYSTTVYADTWFYGAGTGLQLVQDNGSFHSVYSEGNLFAKAHAGGLQATGNLIGGYQWAITPQFLLSTEIFLEKGLSTFSYSMEEMHEGNQTSITTLQQLDGSVGWFLQPGIYSKRFNARIFFNTGLIYSKIKTCFVEQHSRGELMTSNHFHNKHWVNGFRFGVSHESFFEIWPGITARFDMNFTSYPYSIFKSRNHFIAKEKFNDMQMIWSLVWHIDAGSHLLSDIVLHHGLFYYLFHPNKWGQESRDMEHVTFLKEQTANENHS